MFFKVVYLVLRGGFHILKKVKNNRIQGSFYPKDIINL